MHFDVSVFGDARGRAGAAKSTAIDRTEPLQNAGFWTNNLDTPGVSRYMKGSNLGVLHTVIQRKLLGRRNYRGVFNQRGGPESRAEFPFTGRFS